MAEIGSDSGTSVLADSRKRSSAGPFAVVTLLFFVWGFITVMNDVLLPYLKDRFVLSYFQAGLIQFAFFSAFFVVSLIYYLLSLRGADPIQRFGYKRLIMVALVICAAGCALFWPASVTTSYPFFLGALFLLATGVTLLQISANHYAAVLSKPVGTPGVLPSCWDDLDMSLDNLLAGFERLIASLSEAPAAISFAFPGPADYPNGVVSNVGNPPCRPVTVPRSRRTIECHAEPRLGVGVSQLGTNQATAVGAYAFAIQQLNHY